MENPDEQAPHEQPQQPAANDEDNADAIAPDPGEETQSNASTEGGVPDDFLAREQEVADQPEIAQLRPPQPIEVQIQVEDP